MQLEGLPQPVEHELLDDASLRCELRETGQRLGATQRTTPSRRCQMPILQVRVAGSFTSDRGLRAVAGQDRNAVQRQHLRPQASQHVGLAAAWQISSTDRAREQDISGEQDGVDLSAPGSAASCS